ncbi:hypothetical protein GCM10010968_07450 [Agrococcus terreus]|uniref:Transcriptional regulator, AbiEi antitoxin, Type IV TA system n=1 Tax=Agrococcus terreus TaxID=574649 RepID=A0ABQ2KI00_9MICO|nr:hypothetical protein GCM10010968_07450 [Agrococcus terreus]
MLRCMQGPWDDRVPLQRARDLRADDPRRAPAREAALEPIRRGVYAPSTALVGAGREARYLARIEAVSVARSAPMFARESALALHGIPYGAEPERVFTTGDRRTAGLKAGVQHARVDLDPEDVTTVHGLRACTLPYALADVARRREPRVAVAAIDAALHAGLVQRGAILTALDRQGPTGRSRAAAAVAFADAAAESVGESWSRVTIRLLGFEAPELQAVVAGGSGRLWRGDFRWRRPGRRPLLGEFDGMQKYGELAAREGRSGASALAAEKHREDDLRFEHDVARWVWLDVLRPERLEAILDRHEVPRIARRSLWLPDPGPLRASGTRR